MKRSPSAANEIVSSRRLEILQPARGPARAETGAPPDVEPPQHRDTAARTCRPRWRFLRDHSAPGRPRIGVARRRLWQRAERGRAGVAPALDGEAAPCLR